MLYHLLNCQLSPHEPLEHPGLTGPAEGPVEVEVEGDQIDGDQEEGLCSQGAGAGGSDLATGQ